MYHTKLVSHLKEPSRTTSRQEQLSLLWLEIASLVFVNSWYHCRVKKSHFKTGGFFADLTYLVYLNSCVAKGYWDSLNRLYTLTIHLKTITKQEEKYWDSHDEIFIPRNTVDFTVLEPEELTLDFPIKISRETTNPGCFVWLLISGLLVCVKGYAVHSRFVTIPEKQSRV